MDDVAMTYTGILSDQKTKKKFMRVRFSRKNDMDYAEYRLPQVTLERSLGFTEEELASLKFYLKANEGELKKRAREITGLRGFFKS